ncbi:MAG: hypothetical protein ACM3XR_03110 [Bacillota bacterium]
MRIRYGLNDHLKKLYIEIWENTPDSFPVFPDTYRAASQRAKERLAGKLTDDAIALFRKFPDIDGTEQARWGSALKRLLYSLGTDVLELGESKMQMLLDGGFCDATSDFMEKARRFDAVIRLDDIFQALRNVWVMNCIQKLTGCRVETTPSVLAYSMLYPYTDNYLDCTRVPEKNKAWINGRLKKRLAGEKITAGSPLEQKLFRLVELIEGQYDRDACPMVYESLLGIHSAQEESMRQDMKKPGSRPDVLGISIAKGGSSVLADAFLVKGDLSDEEASFFFGFGVILQLLDDMQDAAGDKKTGHRTVFTALRPGNSIESLTNKLFNFLTRLLDEDACFTSPAAIEIKELLKESIFFLLMRAAALNKRMYETGYLERLECHSGLGFEYFRHLHKKISREYGKLKLKFAVNPLEVPMAKAFAMGTLSPE